ncbi:MAG: SDR family oxidoreductase [Ruminococcaceae bacterium]|nr:SDR family oxidoreductase [Oscillospiraceae bacterium]
MRKTVLITGASRGIGRQCALDLSFDYDVIINYNNSEKEAKELLGLLKANGSNSIMIKADVSDRRQVDDMVEKIISYYGRIDALINNAGIARQELFCDVKSEDLKRMTDINLGGTFNCTQAVLKEMINKKCGKIINMSSVWGITGASCEVVYSATKAAIIGFTKALAKEVSLSGITVNAVAPGVIDTDMCKFDEETLEGIREEIPLGRIGDTKDVSGVVKFLLSEAASYITGQVINVSGGFVV